MIFIPFAAKRPSRSSTARNPAHAMLGLASVLRIANLPTADGWQDVYDDHVAGLGHGSALLGVGVEAFGLYNPSETQRVPFGPR